MAFVKAPYGTIAATALLIRDSQMNASGDNDVGSGARAMVNLSVDNSGNAAQQVYAKFYNAAAPTIGTTAPDMIIPVAGGSTMEMSVSRLTLVGTAIFGTAVSYACVTTPGTAGATNPTADVAMTLLIY